MIERILTARRAAVCLLLLGGVMNLVSCAGTASLSGERLLRRGDLDRALPMLLAEEAMHPKDAALKRNLGIAFYRSGNFGEAVIRLRESRQLDAENRETVYFLGRAAEQAGERDSAIEAYGAYLVLGGERRAEAQSRIRELSLENARIAARAALAREDSLATVPTQANTLVVPNFANVGGQKPLDPLSRGLALMLITDLARVRQIQVLERERLNTLQEEIARTGSDSGEFSRQDAPRYGRLLAARRFVQGSFTPLSTTGIQLDAGLIDANSSELFPAGQPVSGALSDVLVLEKALCFQILDALGFAPTAAERAAINRLPTTSHLAFLAFARGIGHEDAGDLAAAIDAYAEAVRLDPNFDVAKLRQDVLEVTAQDLAEGDRAEARRAFGRELDPRDRLLRTGKWSWLVPDGDYADEGGGDTEVTGPNSIGDREGAGSIAVTGRIPRR
ncbi:MAG: hypothetical protein IT349_12525 [Candidatus Eisenbacteria bacterium]|nr:hypothetical protein [Candidatus Eisenbacteria bacterium]MCC7142918.1 hypothetical protein [Candidatus Eisenbacteria bacterium]